MKKKILLGLVALALITVGAYLWSGRNGRFVYTGDLNIPRYGHTATLLPNGKVLVIGGITDDYKIEPTLDGITSSVELYDPSKGKFTVVGNMTTPRVFHTATLLPNGKVLIAGGHGNLNNSVNNIYPYYNSVELYDPTTNKSKVIGMMTTPRSGHNAVLLKNNNVLLIGGISGDEVMGIGIGKKHYSLINPNYGKTNPEIFDPTVGKSTLIKGYNDSFDEFNSVMLPNGNVFLPVSLFKGYSRFIEKNKKNIASIYDYEKNKFNIINGTNDCAESKSILLQNKKVLTICITGDYGKNYAKIYDSITGKFMNKGFMGKKHTWMLNKYTLTLLNNGKILITGGKYHDFAMPTRNDAELYNPQTGEFLSVSPMHKKRFYHTATLLKNGKVLITGGNCNGICKKNEIYK